MKEKLGGADIEPKHLQSVRKLASISILLLIILLTGSVLFLDSLEKNKMLQSILTEVFEHDAKVQLEMSRGETTITAKEFAENVIFFAEDILMYPFYMIVFSILLGLIGLVATYFHPLISAVFLTLACVLSLFTLVPPVLLFFASNTLQKDFARFHAALHKKVI